jgi:hypothetical protein
MMRTAAIMINEREIRDRALEFALKATGPTQLTETEDTLLIARAKAFATFLRGNNDEGESLISP